MSATDLNVVTPLDKKVTWRHQVIPTGIYPPPQDTTVTMDQITGGETQRIRAGTINHHYHSLLKQGRLPPNNFSYQERTWRALHGTRRVENVSVGGFFGTYTEIDTYSGCLSHIQTCLYARAAPSSLIVDNLANRSLTKARLKLKDQDVNLREVWGERHQSAQMIAHAVQRLGKSYSALKRGDFGRAAAALGISKGSSTFSSQWRRNQSKALANGWLELQYGWLPLVHDAYGAAEALNKTLAPSKKSKLIRSMAVSKLSDRSQLVAPITNGTDTWDHSYEVEVKVCLYFRQVSRTLHTLSALGITNPMHAAWELTRFSFLVDWVCNIGNFLSSIDATLGYEYQFGCATTGTRCRETRTRQVKGSVSSTRIEEEESFESDEWFGVSRNGLAPVIGTIPLPVFKDPRSLMHALNAIALFRQSFKR